MKTVTAVFLRCFHHDILLQHLVCRTSATPVGLNLDPLLVDAKEEKVEKSV